MVGGRGDDVRHRADHVAPAVAVEIDRIALERGRHELRQAERAGPRALQLLRPDVAAVQDLERCEKLILEIGLPPPDAGERRGRADHRPLAATVPYFVSMPQIAVMMWRSTP